MRASSASRRVPGGGDATVTENRGANVAIEPGREACERPIEK